MLENKLLISFIISSIITGIYYFLYKDVETNDEKDNIGFYLVIFVFSLIILYLLQIGYLPEKFSGGGNTDTSTLSGGQNFKPPF